MSYEWKQKQSCSGALNNYYDCLWFSKLLETYLKHARWLFSLLLLFYLLLNHYSDMLSSVLCVFQEIYICPREKLTIKINKICKLQSLTVQLLLGKHEIEISDKKLQVLRNMTRWKKLSISFLKKVLSTAFEMKSKNRRKLLKLIKLFHFGSTKMR